jgi:hypothetical protein
LRSPLVEIGLDISAWLKMTEFGCDCCEAWVAMTALDKVKRSLGMMAIMLQEDGEGRLPLRKRKAIASFQFSDCLTRKYVFRDICF